MAIRFDGRVAIVTGAGGGLGRVEALGLAARGARVVVNDFGAGGGSGLSETAEKVAEEIRQAGGEAITGTADVANQEQVEAVVAKAVAAFGKVDILVANAGIMKDSSFAKMDLETFRRIVDVHLVGSMICAKAVWGHMLAAGYGRIMFTTSSSGLYGSYRQANYAAAKMGIVGLMSTLQIEGEKAGIRVNCLAPAAVTNMNDAVMPADMKPLMRIEAVTPAALYLVSEDAPKRTILSAVGGGYSRVFVQETESVFLPPDQWTPEDIAKNFADIAGPAGERYPGSYEHVLAHTNEAAKRL